MNAEFKHAPDILTKTNIKIELSSDINITPFVAQQNVNLFLLYQISNMVSAGEPSLLITGNGIRWKVPVCCAVPDKGMQTVAELAVDADTGEILLSDSTPTDLDALHTAVDHAYAERATLPPGER